MHWSPFWQINCSIYLGSAKTRKAVSRFLFKTPLNRRTTRSSRVVFEVGWIFRLSLIAFRIQFCFSIILRLLLSEVKIIVQIGTL